MKVTDEIVDKVAKLAKLKFEGKERENIKKDMDRILEFMDVLNEVDTECVKPLKYLTKGTLIPRKDKVQIDITKSDALENAPSKDSDYFQVPKVLNK